MVGLYLTNPTCSDYGCESKACAPDEHPNIDMYSLCWDVYLPVLVLTHIHNMLWSTIIHLKPGRLAFSYLITNSHWFMPLILQKGTQWRKFFFQSHMGIYTELCDHFVSSKHHFPTECRSPELLVKFYWINRYQLMVYYR